MSKVKLADFTIAGGGIMGLMTARYLRLKGASVCVLERSGIGSESSWAGGGILLPLYPWRQAEAISAMALRSLALYPGLAQEIQQRSRLDPEVYASGMLICKNPDYEQAVKWCQENRVQFDKAPESLTSKFSTEYLNALCLPQIMQARNPRLLKALHAELLDQGVTFLSHCEMTGIKHDRGKVLSVHTNQGELAVQTLVIATGAWTGDFFNKIHLPTPYQPQIRPVKGQMVLLQADPDTLETMILDGDRYLIPRLDGKILVGSTVEEGAYDKQTDTDTKKSLLDFAYGLMPKLREFPVVAHWAGLRPGTAQGIPYVGRHPQLQNLYLNAGHFRNGLTMAPASAELLVDIIVGQDCRIDPQPYRIDRVN